MSLLTIDVGTTNLVVSVSRAAHAEPREVGARVYTFSGRERSMIRAELFVVSLVLSNASPTTVLAVRALFANGAQLPCAGDVFNNSNATVLCSGTVTDEMEQGGPNWITTLTLMQVSSAGTV